MIAGKSTHRGLLVELTLTLFLSVATASAAQADTVRTASELIEFYQSVHQQGSPTPTTRGIDNGRGVAGVRQGGVRPEQSSVPGVATQQLAPDPAGAPPQSGGGVDFHNIVFDSGSFSIPSHAYRQLDEIGSALAVLGNSFPDMQFVIEGHTDSLGGAPLNRELSFNRANAIRRYLLVKHAIDPTHLEAVGLGETQPLASNSSHQGRALNRRVSIKNNRKP